MNEINKIIILSLIDKKKSIFIFTEMHQCFSIIYALYIFSITRILLKLVRRVDFDASTIPNCIF